MSKKVVLPKEIDKAIKYLRSSGFKDYKIVYHAIWGGEISLDEAIGMGKLHDKFKRFCSNKENQEKIYYAVTQGYEVAPEYISNKEAIDAYGQGKKVRCEYKSYFNKNETLDREFQKSNKEHDGNSLSWYMLCEGKWSIVE